MKGGVFAQVVQHVGEVVVTLEVEARTKSERGIGASARNSNED